MGKKKNKNKSQGVENSDVKEKINEETVVNDVEIGDGGKDQGTGGDGSGGGGTTIAKNAVVLKIDLHCEGCVSKIIKCIRAFEGVVNVEVDSATNKVTVTGKVDPVKLKDKLEKKLKKKVQLLSPVPKKDDAAGKGEKKENNKNAKELPVTTAVLKVPLHCDGCIKKIIKFIAKTKGYHEMKFDKQKEDLVTVTGAMDMKVLAESLKKYLKKDVEIVPPKKDKDKEKEKGKDNAASGAGGGGGKGGGGVVVGQEWVEYWNKMQQAHGYPMVSYVQGLAPPGTPMPVYLVDPYQVNHQATQMFSDENPNACSIM